MASSQSPRTSKKAGGRGGSVRPGQKRRREDMAMPLQDLERDQPGSPGESESEAEARSPQSASEDVESQTSLPPGGATAAAAAAAATTVCLGPNFALPLQGSSDLRARSSLISNSGRSTPTSTMEQGDRAASPPRDTTLTSADREASGQARREEDSETESDYAQPFVDARQTLPGGQSLGASFLEFLRRGTERTANGARLYVTILLLLMAALGLLVCWTYDNDLVMLYSTAAFFLVICLLLLSIWVCLGRMSNS